MVRTNSSERPLPPRAERERKRVELPRIEVSGSEREMGRQLGEARRDSIQALLAAVKANMVDAPVPFGTGLSEPELHAEARRYLAHVERGAPSVYDELRGMSEGAGMSIEDAYLMQVPFGGGGMLVAAEGWRDPGSQLDGHGRATSGGCSTFAVTPDAAAGGRTLIGQTCDFYPNYKEHWIVVHKRPDDGPEQLNATPGGMLTWGNGLNAAGLGVEYNYLSYVDARYGLTPFVIGRMMLDQTTVEEATAVATMDGRACAWNWVLADAGGTVRDIETTATEHAFREPQDGILTHANCYLEPRFVHGDLSVVTTPDSHLRGNRLWQLLALQRGEITVDYVKECYEDHLNQPGAICRHPLPDKPMPENADTNALIVSDLRERKLYACPGPVCEHELVEYSL